MKCNEYPRFLGRYLVAVLLTSDSTDEVVLYATNDIREAYRLFGELHSEDMHHACYYAVKLYDVEEKNSLDFQILEN